MKIFDTQFLGEEVPKGFSAAVVSLDATLTSDLNWKREYDAAVNYAEKGLKIFWEMDVGIFPHLPRPLSDEAQFLSLTLAIKHFKEMFRENFRKNSAGISLYRGSIDLSCGYRWDDEQRKHFEQQSSGVEIDLERQLYCRDVAAGFLTLLAKELPLGLNPWLLFDTTEFHDPVHLANLLNKECFIGYSLAVKGDLLPAQEMGWNARFSPSCYLGRDPKVHHLPKPNVAICLPAQKDFSPRHYETIRPAFDHLSMQDRPYRLIPESLLMTEWEGLDEIIVSSHGLSFEGKRQLMGFCASGGKVVFVPEEGDPHFKARP